MSMNSFGTHIRITTYGESHGSHIGVIIDGFPAGLTLDFDAIQSEMDRRKPGQSALTTARKESDKVSISSGILDNVTTGAPIHLSIPNNDQRSKDYSHLANLYRPSHADFTYQEKYGIRDHRGGGRSSARETACRVAAGALAKQFLQSVGISIQAFTTQIGAIKGRFDPPYELEEIEASPIRCPETEVSKLMEQYILDCKSDGDTCGGVIRCHTLGVPTGLGRPIYDKLEARLGYAMLSINACIGFTMGVGIEALNMRGSEYNDVFVNDGDGIKTKTNNGGGVQGGISNGMPIEFNVYFKPVSSLGKKQHTVTKEGETTETEIKGRHDPCVVPRAVPIVEAMTALVLADFILARRLDRV